MIYPAALMGTGFRVSSGGARDEAQRPDHDNMRLAQPLRSPVPLTQTLPPAPQASGRGAAAAGGAGAGDARGAGAEAVSAAGSAAAPLANDFLSEVFSNNQAALRAGVDSSKKVFWSKVLNVAMTAAGTALLALGAVGFGAVGGYAIAAIAVSAVFIAKSGIDACYSYALWRNLKAAEEGREPPFEKLNERFKQLAAKSDTATAAAVIQDSVASSLSALGVSPKKAKIIGLVTDILLGLGAAVTAGLAVGSWQNSPGMGVVLTLTPLVIRTILSIASNSMDAKRQALNEDLAQQLDLHASTLHDEWLGLRDMIQNSLESARAQNLAALADPVESAELEQRYLALSNQLQTQLTDIAQQFEARTGSAVGVDGQGPRGPADVQANIEIGRADSATIAMMAGSEHVSRFPEMLGVIPGYGGPALLMNAVMLIRTVNAWANLSATRSANESVLANSAEALSQAQNDLATIRTAVSQATGNNWPAQFVQLSQVPAQSAVDDPQFVIETSDRDSRPISAPGVSGGAGLINPNQLA
jgi:hypothetical protein